MAYFKGYQQVNTLLQLRNIPPTSVYSMMQRNLLLPFKRLEVQHRQQVLRGRVLTSVFIGVSRQRHRIGETEKAEFHDQVTGVSLGASPEEHAQRDTDTEPFQGFVRLTKMPQIQGVQRIICSRGSTRLYRPLLDYNAK